MFIEQYHDLVEETKVTSRDFGFHSSDVMHEIVGVLKHLAMTSVADKDILMKLTEAVKSLTLRLVPAQDGPFFYTRSHLSALPNCAVLFSTNFQIIFIFKERTTQFSH